MMIALEAKFKANAKAIAAPIQCTAIPEENNGAKKKRRVNLELLHHRMGHHSARCLLAADENEIWAEIAIRMTIQNV